MYKKGERFYDCSVRRRLSLPLLLRLLVAKETCSCGYSSQKRPAPAVTRRKKSSAPAARCICGEEDARSDGKSTSLKSILTAFSRKKYVEAGPAERVRLKRKSNNKVTF
ncbi:hypothetical protein [Evansella clarkii]|uniref:hypothetical protein n=1 Tax=Evansella clarkii TaxID=79879 RepID=UPI001C44AC7A|nr:hypothetical protein [Evansella clarkii]